MNLDYFPLLEHGPQGDAVIKTSGFGPRWGRNHNGVDYGTVLGQLNGAPIHAPFDGWVTRGTEVGGAGQWVWVQGANGWLFKAFHLSRYDGPNNAHVGAGTVIGYVGNTGASSGPHLHAELWHYGQVQNPEPYFDAAFNAGRFPGRPQEWDEMATPDEIRAIVREEVDKALDAVEWADVAQAMQLTGHGPAGAPTLRDVVERIYNGTKAHAAKDGVDAKAFD